MTIQITLEVPEVQLILASLAKQPLEQVADLFFKIKGHAEQQLAAQQTTEQTVSVGGPGNPEDPSA